MTVDRDVMLELRRHLSDAIMEWQHDNADADTNAMVIFLMTTLLDVTVDFYCRFSIAPKPAELTSLMLQRYNLHTVNA